MDRIATMATALLMVLMTVSAGAVPATGGVSPPVTASDASVSLSTAPSDLRSPVPAENTTARLVIPSDEVDREGLGTVQPDMSATLARTGDHVSQRHNQLTTEARFNGADSFRERVVIIDQALIRIEAETAALADHHHETIEGYSTGTLSEQDILRELSAIDAEAHLLTIQADRLSQLDRRTDRRYEQRIERVRIQLELLQGPVVREIGRSHSMASERTAYVTASETDVVLSTTVEDTYLREAYFQSNRDENASITISNVDAAEEVANTYYSWAFNNSEWTNTRQRGDAYRADMDHSQGWLSAYVDSRTGEVFKEIHRVDADAMPRVTTSVGEGDGLRLMVHRTYPGGPMAVGVYELSTGDPVNAFVTVAGVEVGYTDSAGTVLAIEPRNEYEILVTTPRASANATVEPPQQLYVSGSPD